MARYTKMNPKDFQRMTWDAGIILDDFDPATGEIDINDIRWATTGDNSFSATRAMTDLGAEINNCPENTAQLQKAQAWQAQIAGTAVTVTAEQVAEFLGNADVAKDDLTHIVPRADLSIDDFKDKWLVANYSNLNGEAKGGWCAMHIMKSLSVDGFSGTFGKNKNGQFPYTLKAFYDMEDMSKVPFDIYMKAGEAETTGGTVGQSANNNEEDIV